jgi:hypothetical protein
VLDGRGGLSAWLHDGARLAAFAQEPLGKQGLISIDAPIVIEDLPTPWDFMTATSSRLVRVRATSVLAPRTFVGVMRKSDVAPRDVVAVSGSGAVDAVVSSGNAGAAPELRALWLAPLEQRERSGCGSWTTHRVAFENVDGATAPEAFLVMDSRTGGTALIDARYAGVFGFGRVGVCDQGLDFVPGEPAFIEVRPVSASFAIGESWWFSSDGTGTTDLARLSSPASALAERILEPFPVPGRQSAMHPTFKEVAIFVMGGGMACAGLAALFAWVIIPARRRRMRNMVCPACAQQIPIDSLDPKTDGFFCPSCGAAGFWKGTGTVVDARALPRVGP